ncbi:hypothetical protein ACK3SF_03700 [Candidatus Nanosalina sp. VS9-1]|uniref:hypothetical protein n=1 Tax=Candidatus Nanosalina sp. VS9-1 TaxID=3388566 RepID=UPI0039E13AE1
MRDRDQGLNSGENRDEAASESRREFLKTLMLGTAATGLYASLPSVSAFSISSEDPVKFFNSTSSSANVEIQASGNVDIKDNDIVNARRVEASEVNFSGSNSNGKTIVYDSELDTLVVVDE